MEFLKNQKCPTLESRKSPISMGRQVGITAGGGIELYDLQRNLRTLRVCDLIMYDPLLFANLISVLLKGVPHLSQLFSHIVAWFSFSFSFGLLANLCLYKNSPCTTHCRRMMGCPQLSKASRRREEKHKLQISSKNSYV